MIRDEWNLDAQAGALEERSDLLLMFRDWQEQCSVERGQLLSLMPFHSLEPHF